MHPARPAVGVCQVTEGRNVSNQLVSGESEGSQATPVWSQCHCVVSCEWQLQSVRADNQSRVSLV